MSGSSLGRSDPAIIDSFSKWRRRFWPVHGSEIPKLLPLLFMKFCVSFNYSVLHATKDTLIVTSHGSGAEAIPILKGWVVLFFAFLAMIVYSKLSNHLSRSALFYATLTPFILFFALYGFVLYPHRDLLCPHKSADFLLSVIGKERGHWIVAYRYWMDALFFLVSELWGGVVIALLFWGFANRVNTMNEASRFYTILSAGGHVGVMAAGPLIWYCANSFASTEFALTIQYLMGVVTFISLCIMTAYFWTDRHVNRQEEVATVPQAKPRTKLSLKESLKYLVQSPYLGCIALMVIGYSMSVNMVEVIWKATLKLKYPGAKDYQAFMGVVSSITGAVSFILAFAVGGNVIRKFGWYLGAQLTPFVLGCVSALFLAVYFISSSFHGSIALAGGGALFILVVCGAIHNIACKSMKYCLFDPTKEMAYIPLDEEAKVKGKAAVDVVASRFGKSGSSWIQIGLMEMVGVGSVLSIAPYLAPCVVLAVALWMTAIRILKQRTQSMSV